MISRIFKAVVWMLISAGLIAAYMKHGQLIGGTRYFVHMRMEGAQLAQISLIVSSVCLPFCILMQWHKAGLFWARAVGVIGVVFAANFIYPMGLRPWIYPFGSFGLLIPLLAAVAGFVTAGELKGTKAEIAP